MTARYIDSVPILHKEWIIRGYIWWIGPPRTMPLTAIYIEQCVYIGQLPDGGVLLATQTGQPPDPQDLEKLGFSRESSVRPWVVKMYNGEDENAPLAVHCVKARSAACIRRSGASHRPTAGTRCRRAWPINRLKFNPTLRKPRCRRGKTRQVPFAGGAGANRPENQRRRQCRRMGQRNRSPL